MPFLHQAKLTWVTIGFGESVPVAVQFCPVWIVQAIAFPEPAISVTFCSQRGITRAKKKIATSEPKLLDVSRGGQADASVGCKEKGNRTGRPFDLSEWHRRIRTWHKNRAQISKETKLLFRWFGEDITAMRSFSTSSRVPGQWRIAEVSVVWDSKILSLSLNKVFVAAIRVWAEMFEFKCFLAVSVLQRKCRRFSVLNMDQV